MTDLAILLAAAVFVVFAVHRVVVLHRDEADPAQRYVSGFAWCMGMAMFTSAPVVVAALNRLGRVEPWATLVSHGLRILGLSFLVLVSLALASSTPEPRSVARHIRLTAAVQVASALLLLAADTDVRNSQLLIPDDRRWALAAYNALFAVYGCWCLLVLVKELGRNARSTEPGHLRTGLRLMTLAAAVGMVWTLWVWEDIVDNLTEGRQQLTGTMTSGSLGVITAVLATGGATATLWGGMIAGPARRLRVRRTYRALEPLWSALHTELPEIAFDPSVATRRPGPGRGEFALYRRVIEIRDGHLALRPYFHADVPRWVGKSTDPARGRPAVLEAATIAAGLERKRSGRPPGDAIHAKPTSPNMSATIEAEADWLLEVTDAFTSSPVVEEIRARVRRGLAEG